jgi:hypothetical protein
MKMLFCVPNALHGLSEFGDDSEQARNLHASMFGIQQPSIENIPVAQLTFAVCKQVGLLATMAETELMWL